MKTTVLTNHYKQSEVKQIKIPHPFFSILYYLFRDKVNIPLTSSTCLGDPNYIQNTETRKMKILIEDENILFCS